ncbi:MAG TPA: flagella basal body P-ring formation protein FlgA [Vampirovibrionales bacterium]
MATGTRRTSRATSRTSRSGGGGGVRTNSAASVIFIVIFIVIALGGYAIFQQQQANKKLAEAQRTVDVIVAAIDLEKGHQIGPNDLMIKPFHYTSVPNGAFRNVSDPRLIGGTVTLQVLANQPILTSYIGVPEERLLPAEGESEITVTLSGQNAKDRFIRKGQVVSAHRIFTTSSGNRITQLLSKKGRILDVQRYDSLAANVKSSGESQVDVTLATSPDDAKKISVYRDSGQVKLIDGANQEPPANKVSLFQEWMGIEKIEKELTSEVGAELMTQ